MLQKPRTYIIQQQASASVYFSLKGTLQFVAAMSRKHLMQSTIVIHKLTIFRSLRSIGYLGHEKKKVKTDYTFLNDIGSRQKLRKRSLSDKLQTGNYFDLFLIID